MYRLSTNGSMAVACVAFLGIGLTISAVGPALPQLAGQTGESLAALGGIFTAIFLGALLALPVAGRLTDRFGPPRVLMGGTLLLALGGLGITVAPGLALKLLAALVSGIGQGTTNISANVLVIRLFPHRTVTALNVINIFFGLGAVTGPVIAGLTMRTLGTALTGLWTGAAAGALVALLAPFLQATEAPGLLGRGKQAAGAGAILRSPALWGIGLMLLVYVGTESGLGGWTSTYLLQTTPLDATAGAFVTSAFWLSLTVGRVVAAVAGSRFQPVQVLQAGLVGSLVGGAMLMLGVGSIPATIGGIMLLGVCYGPIYPTAVALTTERFPQAPGTAGSTVVAMGALGGTLLPWVQGLLLEGAGPLPFTLVIALGGAGMLLLHRLTTRFGG